MTDDLMRLFGTDRVAGLVKNLDEDTPNDPKILSASIEQAQKRVESRNFQTRKTVLEYDDVMNQQRNIIYDQRRKVLDGEDIHSYVSSMITDVIDSTVHGEIAKLGKVSDVSEIAEIITPFRPMFIIPQEVPALFPNAAGMSADDISAVLQKKAFDVYEQKEKRLGNIPGTDTPLMRELERVIMLRVVDEYWMDHIERDDRPPSGYIASGLRTTKPRRRLQKEGFEMFEAMVNGIKEEVVRRIFTVRVNINQKLERKSVSRDFTDGAKAGSGPKRQPVRAGKKIGRNDPCPCGKLRPNGCR